MPLYVAECYIPGLTREQCQACQNAAIAMCQQFTQWGRPVRYVRSLVVPSESRCLCLYEAPDAALVCEVNDAMQIP